MKCHICNKIADTFTHEKTNIVYYMCKECEYIFKSSKYHQDFDTQKERYNLHTNDEEDEGYKAYFRRFLDFTLPLIKHPNNALDFGCGASTLMADMMKKKDINCDYFDPIYYPNTQYDSKKYQLITSIEVFEHLHQPKEVFASLVKLLEKDGHLAIQTEFCSTDVEKFKKWYYHQDTTHIVFFRVKTFEKLASMFGCEVIATDGIRKVLIKKI